MLVRATLILIALFVGGWMVFDGIHVLIGRHHRGGKTRAQKCAPGRKVRGGGEYRRIRGREFRRILRQGCARTGA